MIRTAVVLASVWGCCVSADAQIPRGRVAGIVRDAAGVPRRGAEVLLFSRPLRGDHVTGEQDLVTTTSDARGRFRAMVVPGRPYTAWATASHGDDEVIVSTPVHSVLAGTTVRLDLGAPRPRARLTLGGEAELVDAARRLEVIGYGPNRLTRTVRFDAAGAAPLPAVPGGRFRVRVLAASGCLYSAEHGWPESGDLSVRLRARRPVLVEVRDAATKRPVAGGTVAVREDDAWRAGIACDAKGNATVPVTPGQGLTCAVAAPGYAETLFTLSPKRVAAKGVRQRIELHAGYSVRGRLLAGGAPAAGAVLLLRSMTFRLEDGSLGYDRASPPRTTRTDEKGRFSITGCSPAFPNRICLVPQLAHWERVRWERGSPHAPVVWLRLGGGHQKEDVALGDVRLEDLHPMDIAVTRKDGAPLERLRCFFGEASGSTKGFPGAPHELTPGRRGRLRVLVREGFAYSLAGVDGMAVGVTTKKRTGKAATRIDLQLVEGRVLSGKVVDRKAKPVAGAVVQPSFAMFGMAGMHMHRETIVLRQAVSQLRARTGADGTFRLVLPAKIRVRLHVTYNTAGKSVGASHPHKGGALGGEGEDIDDVLVVLPVR